MLTSSQLYDKVDKLRQQRGISIAKLNSLAGISHNTLNSWKQRGTMPKLEVLESICFALEVPLASFLYDVYMDQLSGEEITLLSCWRKINEGYRGAILSLLEVMSKKD